MHCIAVTLAGPFSECNDTSADCSIVCNSNSECENFTLSCFPTTNCDIDCLNSGSCENSRINIKDNNFTGDFNLLCDTTDACRYSNIRCNAFGDSCYINCDGTSACRDLQVNTLEMAHTGSFNMTLVCGRLNACRDSTIYCSYNRGCHITCGGNSASNGCFNSIINGNTYLEPHSGNMRLDCLTQNTCEEATIHCLQFGTCDILCDGTGSCRYSTIYCPDNQDCNINCYAQNGCRDSIIYCPRTNGSCNIDCVGGGACQDMVVHCFDDNYCNLTTCSGSSACSDTMFINDSSTSYTELILLNASATTTTTPTTTTGVSTSAITTTVTTTTTTITTTSTKTTATQTDGVTTSSGVGTTLSQTVETTDGSTTTPGAQSTQTIVGSTMNTLSLTPTNTESPSNKNGGNNSDDTGLVVGMCFFILFIDRYLQYKYPCARNKTTKLFLAFWSVFGKVCV